MSAAPPHILYELIEPVYTEDGSRASMDISALVFLVTQAVAPGILACILVLTHTQKGYFYARFRWV